MFDSFSVNSGKFRDNINKTLREDFSHTSLAFTFFGNIFMFLFHTYCFYQSELTLSTQSIQTSFISQAMLLEVTTTGLELRITQFVIKHSIWPNGRVFVYKLSSSGFDSSDFEPVLRKEFLRIQATIDCGFSLKSVHDITRTYSQTL